MRYTMWKKKKKVKLKQDIVIKNHATLIKS